MTSTCVVLLVLPILVAVLTSSCFAQGKPFVDNARQRCFKALFQESSISRVCPSRHKRLRTCRSTRGSSLRCSTATCALRQPCTSRRSEPPLASVAGHSSVTDSPVPARDTRFDKPTIPISDPTDVACSTWLEHRSQMRHSMLL